MALAETVSRSLRGRLKMGAARGCACAPVYWEGWVCEVIVWWLARLEGASPWVDWFRLWFMAFWVLSCWIL